MEIKFIQGLEKVLSDGSDPLIKCQSVYGGDSLSANGSAWNG